MKIDKQIIDGGLRCRWRHFTLIIIIPAILFVPIFLILLYMVIEGCIHNLFTLFVAAPFAVFTIILLRAIIRNLFGKEFLQLDKNGLLLESTLLFYHKQVNIPLEQIHCFKVEDKCRSTGQSTVCWTELNVILDGRKRQMIVDDELSQERRISELQDICDELNRCLRLLKNSPLVCQTGF